MQLLNPYMLLTLGFIPLIIIIHTLKPKPKPVDVTNLFLWQEVLEERNRNLSFERLKRNLPLWLQIFMVVLAALALAQPTWTYQTAAKGNLILVIDTSASMKTRVGSGHRFDLARQKAIQLIQTRDPDQKILMIEAGKKPVVRTGWIDDAAQARRLARKIQPSDAAARLEPAIYLALSFVDPAQEDFVYLITDGAGSDFSAVLKAHPKIRPIIIPGGQSNVGITKFEFRQQVDLGDYYEFLLEVKNFNPTAVECPVRLSIDRTVLLERVVAFAAREKKLMILPYAGLINGIARASLAIEDDFAVDNQALLSLNAAKDIWILLVSNGNPFLEKLLAAYPNFKVNKVKEVIPSFWPEQTARHDIVIVDRLNFPETDRGNLLLIDAYSPSIPISKSGRILRPTDLVWNRQNPLMANVDLAGIMLEESARLTPQKALQPVIESNRSGLMYAIADKGLRAVLIGFDITRSDLPLKVAFPVMMSNIFNWLNPHKLEFSTLQTRPGDEFDIYLNPQTDTLYTRAPREKWQKHRVNATPFKYQNTDRVGLYTIAENGKERYFTVNLADESESDISARLAAQRPDHSISTVAAAQNDMQQPLWMLFILAGTVLLVIEWYAWLKTK